MASERRRAYTLGLPLILALGMASPLAADEDYGCPWGGPGFGPGMMGGYGGMMGYHKGPGMMGGYGMGPGMMGGYGRGYGPLAALDLTDEQRQKIRDIQAEQRKQQWELGGKIIDEQIRLNELYAADTPDPKEVGAAYERIAKLQRQRLEAHVAARNRLQSVLTKEQREQLRQWQRGFAGGPGPGYGPGRYMPGPGMMRR